MNIFDSRYYLVASDLFLFLLCKNKYEELEASLAIPVFVFLSNYLLVFLFPVFEPRMAPAILKPPPGDSGGDSFSHFNRFVQSGGSLLGGLFFLVSSIGAMVRVLFGACSRCKREEKNRNRRWFSNPM